MQAIVSRVMGASVSVGGLLGSLALVFGAEVALVRATGFPPAAQDVDAPRAPGNVG